jgi:demethylmenaquinone methyltransferase / 2-methoxy-6-polyprenyl-1,4-benzoquinol methylase
MFDRVARGYDRTNTLLSVGNAGLWRVATTRAVDPQPGERILDVAAGTGTSTAALARRGATVVGFDLSEGMLGVARRRFPQLEFVSGDAERIPFADDQFDAVTISFGLRNVRDPHAALREMFRVTRPGGRLVVCEFSQPPFAPFRAGYRLYLRHLLPRAARATSSNPDAYTYLSETIEQWPDQQTLSGWIRGAGFGRVVHRDLTGGIVALHRGTKPSDGGIRASAARTARTRAHRPAGRARRSG